MKGRHGEPIYDVLWDGPFVYEKERINGTVKKEHVLYQLYGRHPLYGSDHLLYIGRTNRGADRLREHDNWIQYEQDNYHIRLASVGVFSSWRHWESDGWEPYALDQGINLESIESLLIHANQPCYNTSSKNTITVNGHFTIFNTGHFGEILPESSTRRYID